MPALDSLYRSKSGLWAPYYILMEQQLGATATLLDFGNQQGAGLVTAATWAGRKFNASGLSPTWTPSEALSAFDVPFDLKLESNWLGLAPILDFNGTDEDATSPDAAYWTVAGGFSVGAWINTDDVTNVTMILTKLDLTTGATQQEWELLLTNAGEIGCIIVDDSAATWIGRSRDAPLETGVWYHTVGTWDGTAADSGVKVYINGVQADDKNIGSGIFVGLEDKTSLVYLAARRNASALGNFFNGRMLGGPWAPFFVQAVLTAAQIKNLYDNMRLGLGV